MNEDQEMSNTTKGSKRKNKQIDKKVSFKEEK